MNKKWIGIGISLFAPLLYGVLPTIVVRLTGYGITQKIPKQKGIALTFDDGPHPIFTEMLLDLLKKYGIRATFFVVGEKVEAYPSLVKRMQAEGHQIGIHHYSHISNWRLTARQLYEQLEKSTHAIQEATGHRPTLYRPPWGRFNLFTLRLAKPYQIIIWSHIFGDWKIKNCGRLLEKLRDVPGDGSIIVLHDDGSNPAADENAPDCMLHQLELFLIEKTAQGVPFLALDKQSP